MWYWCVEGGSKCGVQKECVRIRSEPFWPLVRRYCYVVLVRGGQFRKLGLEGVCTHEVKFFRPLVERSDRHVMWTQSVVWWEQTQMFGPGVEACLGEVKWMTIKWGGM
ncbi:hypothetical protein DPMN_091657 [Dreissena polymorpha]|uniref:Uncharacterized protein n=1 Tax=Dreissena polymorpha TaxID=45954 RepID=A0A9D4L088_DREPO|nr:hypothetical protein DPMN_091657 [Dreissena polymorpha]